MKRINLLIFKKRFYLFFIMCLSCFFMNLFLWNETTQFIRARPVINRLKRLSDNNVYLLNYIPEADRDGAITDLGDWERADIASFLLTFQHYLYVGKEHYLNGDDNFTLIATINSSDIERNVIDKYVDIAFKNDLILLEPSLEIITRFEAEAGSLRGDLSLQSISERHRNEFTYYFVNFLFGLSISMILLAFGLFSVYLIIISSLEIFAQEIKLLRIIGLTHSKIRKNFECLFAIPIILSAIVFLFFIQNTGFKLIIEDYLYLTLLNVIICFCSKYIIDRRLVKGLKND